MNILRVIRVSALVLLAVLSLPNSSAQAAYMDCLEKSQGQVVEWRDSWSTPAIDDGQQYRILTVAIRDKIPDRSVTLELSAVGPAKVNRRTLVVTTEEKARVVCESLVKQETIFRLPEVDKEQERLAKFR